MATVLTIEIPDIVTPEWAIENGRAIAQIMLAAKLSATMKVFLIRAGSAQFNAQDPIMRSDQQYLLNLPVFYQAGVPLDVAGYSDTAGAAYSQAKAQAIMTQLELVSNKLNELLAQERTVQVLPTSAQ